MIQPPPARPGDPLDAVETPALVVDLDAFEANLDAMAEAIARTGVAFRPHAKTHKSPWVAQAQIARGAVGVCVQKVAEAEVMVDGGIRDVLVTNQIWGARKLDRLAALARRATIGVCVDDARNAADLGRAAEAAGSTLDVLVEIDVGAGRCGVDPGAEAVALARRVAETSGLTFRGLQAYHGGAQHLRTPDERELAIGGAIAAARETRDAILATGLACPVVTGAGTGTWEIEAASGVYTELQAGSYCFMDADYARNLGVDGQPVSAFRHALFVLGTVMSARPGVRAVVDAGKKSFSLDSGMPVPHVAGWQYSGASDEHGTLTGGICPIVVGASC